MDETSVLKC
ncbi:hypothetical protein R3I93_011492 [Phoxinus phoxinus]|uniref:Uncharacterized protein n=1 Tax=Phoxinus phoxinus TaxID=58324 RepID=A0AAN9CW57_9TELE